MTIKKNDVFHFRYSPEYAAKMSGDLYWAFDGQLIAEETAKGILLRDTYWWSTSDGRTFTPEEAEAKGTLEFICNLADVTDCSQDIGQYYDEGDWFNLSRQHGCYQWHVVKKSAQRSQRQMIASLETKIDEMTRKIKWAEDDRVRTQQTLEQVRAGNLNGYI